MPEAAKKTAKKRTVVRKPADERIATGLRRLSIGEFQTCAEKFVAGDRKAAEYFRDRLNEALDGATD